MNATATVPPVLDQTADPIGYNVDKLRALAGSLATRKGAALATGATWGPL